MPDKRLREFALPSSSAPKMTVIGAVDRPGPQQPRAVPKRRRCGRRDRSHWPESLGFLPTWKRSKTWPAGGLTEEQIAYLAGHLARHHSTGKKDV